MRKKWRKMYWKYIVKSDMFYKNKVWITVSLSQRLQWWRHDKMYEKYHGMVAHLSVSRVISSMWNDEFMICYKHGIDSHIQVMHTYTSDRCWGHLHCTCAALSKVSTTSQLRMTKSTKVMSTKSDSRVRLSVWGDCGRQVLCGNMRLSKCSS